MFDDNFGKCGPIFKMLSSLIRKKILYVYITKISISPAMCCYTTLWKSKIQKCYWFWQRILNKLLTCSWGRFEDLIWHLTLVRQDVSRLLTLTDWYNIYEICQTTSRINSWTTWTLFSWTLLHHGDFFTMIIFAPSSFFLGYTSYICCTDISKIISAIFLWQVT